MTYNDAYGLAMRFLLASGIIKRPSFGDADANAVNREGKT